MKTSATIAIVGRPNVGKSTIFNRLIGKRYAITAEEAGTTRDRIFHVWEVGGYMTLLIDTGGLESEAKEQMESSIKQQALMAIEEADLIIFTVDYKHGTTKDDFLAADLLRRSKKPIIFVANKSDSTEQNNLADVYKLGFGDPIKISAIHDLGIQELEEEVMKNLKKLKVKKLSTKIAPHAKEDKTSICILGKPNSGKSSLFNALIGAEKVIVSDIPGTTRDIIDTEFIYKDKKFVITDTAGIRRAGKVEKGVEKISILRALYSVEKVEVVVLLIDGKLGPTSQDCHIAEIALEKQKGLIIAVNKIDLLEGTEQERNTLIYRLRRKFPFVPWAPVVFISAKFKRNIYKILDLANEIMIERQKRISTSELNAFLQRVTFKHLPASAKLKKPKFMYVSQVDIRPPKFILFFKHPENLHFSYPRYLENQIREKYGFTGTSIELSFKSDLKMKR